MSNPTSQPEPVEPVGERSSAPKWDAPNVYRDGVCLDCGSRDGTHRAEGHVVFGLMGDGRHVHFSHRCLPEKHGNQWPGAPLPLGPWRVVSTEPLTVEPSVYCADCGLHGWITDGEWRWAA